MTEESIGTVAGRVFMTTAYEAFTNGAIQARKLAQECLDDAESTSPSRAFYLIAEHDRHIERAEFYEGRVSMLSKPEGTNE